MRAIPLIEQANGAIAHVAANLPLGHYLSDGSRIRPTASAALSFVANCTFAALNVLLGIYSSSIWFVTLGAYYAMLSIMRFVTVRLSLEDAQGDPALARTRQVRAMHIDGILLMVLTLLLSASVAQTILDGARLPTNDIIAISMATYAFIKLSLAISGLIGTRGSNAPVMRTLKSIALVDALVSIMSLQTIMIDSFGGQPDFRFTMTVATGAAVCATSFIIGLLLLREKRWNGRVPRNASIR